MIIMANPKLVNLFFFKEIQEGQNLLFMFNVIILFLLKMNRFDALNFEEDLVFCPKNGLKP